MYNEFLSYLKVFVYVSVSSNSADELREIGQFEAVEGGRRWRISETVWARWKTGKTRRGKLLRPRGRIRRRQNKTTLSGAHVVAQYRFSGSFP